MAISQIQNASLASGVPGAGNLPAGSVLQVVNATYNTFGSNNTNTYADTGLTASITPKFSTSKILILGAIRLDTRVNSGYNACNVQLLRGASVLQICERIVYLEAGASTNSRLLCGTSPSFIYLDSPATTSSTTYKFQYNSDVTGNGAIVYLNNATTGTNTFSSITLLEIAA